jgi:hypothetical protein
MATAKRADLQGVTKMAGQNTTGGMGQDKNQSTQNQAGQQSSGQQSTQSQYWKGQFQNEPYYQQGRQFEEYEQAYQSGEQGRSQYGSSGQSFDQSEQNLRADYEKSTSGNSKALKWDEGGKHAAKAAWERAGQSSDRDMQQGKQGSDTGSSKRTS